MINSNLPAYSKTSMDLELTIDLKYTCKHYILESYFALCENQLSR